MSPQKISRLAAGADELADGHARAWQGVAKLAIPLTPAPLPMVAAVSPYLATQTGHGRVRQVGLQMAHDGNTLSIRLSWRDPDRDDAPKDLDEFADAVAVMFPLADGASALTMGSPERPVNAWLWMADLPEPLDVLASGYATSERHPAKGSGLTASAYHEGGEWAVVLQRPLAAADPSRVSLEPGGSSAIAIAVWEGSNRERSAQKAVSGEFTALTIEA